MTSFFTLARWTFLETLRDRLLWGYGVFALLLLLGLFAVGQVPWGETHYIVGQLGYSAIALVSQVLAALLAAFQLGRDAERRVHYMILGRQINRFTYLAGRFAGLWLAAFIFTVSLVLLLLALNSVQASYRPPLWSLLGAIPAIMLQVSMVLSVAILLYQATTSAILAMLLALLAVVIGRSVASVQLVLSNFGDFSRTVGKAGAYLFPNLELLTFNSAIIYEKMPDPGTMFTASLYAVAYTLASMALAGWLFSRKDL